MKLSKKIVIMLTCVFVVSLTTPIGVLAMDNANVVEVATNTVEVLNNGVSITPVADNIVWVLKSENGKAYKRQFNRSTGQYIGDWILMP